MAMTNGNQNHANSHPPEWLEKFVTIIANCIEAHSPMGPLGWRYLEEEDYTELHVYPTLVEIVGGEWDGELVVAGFSLP